MELQPLPGVQRQRHNGDGSQVTPRAGSLPGKKKKNRVWVRRVRGAYKKPTSLHFRIAKPVAARLGLVTPRLISNCGSHGRRIIR